MSQDLLRRADFAKFVEWCKKMGYETRPGKGGYQLIQIKTGPTYGFQVIYDNDSSPEYLSINKRLEFFVKRFYELEETERYDLKPIDPEPHVCPDCNNTKQLPSGRMCPCVYERSKR